MGLVIVGRSINDVPGPPQLEWNAPSGAESMVPFDQPVAPAPPAAPSQAAPAEIAGAAPPSGADPAAASPVPAGVSPPPGAKPATALPAPGLRGISPDVEPPVLIRRLDPQYPKLALQNRVAGTVRVQATIGTDGRVHDPLVVSGQSLLNGAALSAVKEWIYRPARLHGQDVTAPISIDVRFGSR
jgi:protein TonB